MIRYNFQIRRNTDSKIIGKFVATNAYGIFIYYEQLKTDLTLWIKLNNEWQAF
jgi:hypothetical protein